MHTTDIQKEIILLTGSRFAKKSFPGTEINDKNANQEINLEEACWDGLMIHLLPDILQMEINTRINLWNIEVAEHFLNLHFSVAPVKIDELNCLNPHIFLPFQCIN